jgi:hypothetical protein
VKPAPIPRPRASRRPAPRGERELAAALHSLSDHSSRLVESTRDLAALGWKRLQARLVEAGFAVALAAVALLAGVALVLAAALRIVAGLDHALARWSGEPWVGELGAGAAVLVALVVAARLVRRRARRAVLAGAPRPRGDAPPPEK